MLNDGFEPRKGEEDVLGVLKADSRLAPAHIYDELGVNPGSAQHWLDRLHAAGWVTRPKKGLYELSYDPREMSDEELAQLYLRHAIALSDRDSVIQWAGEHLSDSE